MKVIIQNTILHLILRRKLIVDRCTEVNFHSCERAKFNGFFSLAGQISNYSTLRCPFAFKRAMSRTVCAKIFS